MSRANTQAVPARAGEPSQFERIKAMLERSSDRMLAVLPRHVTPEKQIQVVSTLLFKTPDLMRCEPLSIVSAVLEACELGLSLSKSSGEAYLVPYGNQCQFLTGYRGLVKLAYQSGQVASIQGRVVRAGDEFRYGYEPDLALRHVPALDSDEATVTHVYAVAKLANGERLAEVLTAAEVEAVRARSRAGKSGPWVTDWPEMAKKTAIRRLAKILPRSERLERALELDDQQYEVEALAVPPDDPRLRKGVEGLGSRLGLEAPDEPREPGDDDPERFGDLPY